MITTSPPRSVHFVGAAVQRATGARWIADLRDPIVANQHRRDDTTAARARQAANEQVARLVARRADAVSCVSEAIADEVRDLGAARRRARDRERLRLRRLRGARVHAGLALPDHAHGELLRQARSAAVPAGVPRRRTSTPSPASSATSARPTASGRSRSGSAIGSSSSTTCRARSRCGYQRDSEALLLLVPDAGGRGKGVLSGKVFEYLAAGRPILAVVPPDGAAAELDSRDGRGRRRRARRRRRHQDGARGDALPLRERRPPVGRAREGATRTGSRGAPASRRWPRSSAPSCRHELCAPRRGGPSGRPGRSGSA